MLKDCVAILNITTKNITLMICENGINNTINFVVKETVDYYTYYNGAFTDVKEYESVLTNLLKKVFESSNISSINKIYVGVEGEFIKTYTKNQILNFVKPKKITEKDIKQLFINGYEDIDSEHTLIHKSAVYYSVKNIKIYNPLNKIASSLSGRLSYVFISNYFKEVTDKILKNLGVNEIYYISNDYAISQQMFTKEQLNDCRIIVNISFITTSVCITFGNGLLYSSAFPFGQGTITAYLHRALEKDYFVCEELTNKLNLGLSEDTLNNYIVSGSDIGDFTFDASEVNNIAKGALDEIGDNIENAIKKCTLKIPSDTEIYFTGDGVCDIRGGIEYLATKIGAFTKVISPKLPRYSKPKYSETISLVKMALAVNDNNIFFE